MFPTEAFGVNSEGVSVERQRRIMEAWTHELYLLLDQVTDPEVISQNIHLLALLTQEENRRIDCQAQWALQILTRSKVRTAH